MKKATVSGSIGGADLMSLLALILLCAGCLTISLKYYPVSATSINHSLFVVRFVGKYLKVMGRLNGGSDQERKLVQEFTNGYLRQDGVFVLRYDRLLPIPWELGIEGCVRGAVRQYVVGAGARCC